MTNHGRNWRIWVESKMQAEHAHEYNLAVKVRASLKTAESHGFGSQVAKVAKTQSINVTGPGKPGHQIDGASEKVLGQWPDGEGE